VWNDLSEEEQRWLQEAADESAIYQTQLWKAAVEEALREVQKAGVKISYPSKEPFLEKVAGVYSQVFQEQQQLEALVQRIQQTTK
jgi:TRAP-type C4-dicarboxylate transport system substrate-binding protein